MKKISLTPFTLMAIVIVTFSSFKFPDETEILKRDKVDPKYTWDLTHIYQNENLWEKDFSWVEKEIVQYKIFEGVLGESSKKLLNYLQFDDEMGKKLGLLSLYAKLSRDLNIQDQKNKERWGRIKQLQNKVATAKYFVRSEILEIPEKTLSSYIAGEDNLQIYKHLINDIIKAKEHTLNKEQERMFSLSSSVRNVTPNIYFDMQVDRKDPRIIDDKGNEIILSGNNWEASKVSFDRSFRERAYKGFFNPFMDQKNTYASLLNGRLQAKVFEARMHNYNSSIKASLLPNNIPVSVYNSLIESVNDNTAPLHRWMSIKKEALGFDTLNSYDSYVTIFSSNDKRYTFEEAKHIIIESLKPLGEEYIRDLNMAFNNRWVDVYFTEGKAVGAYSSGVTYGVHPYVLINWTGTVADLIELTHEMGHCMHAYYTGITQPFVYANYSSFAAEIASTTNEALLMHYLIENAKTPDEKVIQIEKYLNNVRDIFYWTSMASEFENTIYEKVESGEELSSDDFCEIIKDLSMKYYGKDMKITEEETYIWAPLRHLYIVDFYLYQYAVGFAASEQIAAKLIEDPTETGKYLNFLKAGSSAYPIDAIKLAGVDMNSKEPVLSVSKKMNEMLDEFELLMRQK